MNWIFKHFFIDIKMTFDFQHQIVNIEKYDGKTYNYTQNNDGNFFFFFF